MSERNRCLFTMWIAVMVAATMTVTAGPASATHLYYIDFDSPPHQVGQPPVAGSGPPPRDTISSIPFGTPTVVSSFGMLTDQPCEFDSFDGQGDQIRLITNDISVSDEYGMECDILIANVAAGGDFGILFDTPQVRTVRFTASGDVNVYVPGVFSGTVATYTMGQPIHLWVDILLYADTWLVFLDYMLVHEGSFGGATELQAIRFSTNVTPSPPGVSAALDNINVHDESLTSAVENSTWGRIKEIYR